MDRLSLYNAIKVPEFDYTMLCQVLSHYRSPRDQITKWLKNGTLIRVKKGLYVFGPDFGRPYSPYILANLIYGPSYVSGLTALSYYGAIPERVEVIQSSTPNKNKEFMTPVGRFTYSYLNMKKYSAFVCWKKTKEKRAFLIASPEKAFIEIISKIKGINSKLDLMDWIESMRVDEDFLKKLNLSKLNELEKLFPTKISSLLKNYLQEIS